METTTHTPLPSGDEIPSSQTLTWRIADGHLKKGSEKLGTEEFCPGNKILGKVLRFGIQEGIGKEDGKPWKQLEVDLETRFGMERVKVNYNFQQDIWPTQGIGLAKYLTALAAGDIIVIEPKKSAKPNPHGSFTTFVDVDRFDVARGRRVGILTDYDGQKFADCADDIFVALGDHPLYKVRVSESEEGEREFLDQLLAEKGFTPIFGNEAKWIKWVNKTANEEFTSFDDLDEDWLNWVRTKVSDLDADPILAAKPGKPKPPVAGDDPFADD